MSTSLSFGWLFVCTNESLFFNNSIENGLFFIHDGINITGTEDKSFSFASDYSCQDVK